MTWCPSCPLTASGLLIVQLLPSLSLTNILPSSLIVPAILTAFIDVPDLLVSGCCAPYWARATTDISTVSANEMIISFFILFSFYRITRWDMSIQSKVHSKEETHLRSRIRTDRV